MRMEHAPNGVCGFAAERGLGFLVMNSRMLGQLGVAVFAILLIGLVTLAADSALALALRRLLGHRAGT